jgi:hypothetical protein
MASSWFPHGSLLRPRCREASPQPRSLLGPDAHTDPEPPRAAVAWSPSPIARARCRRPRRRSSATPFRAAHFAQGAGAHPALRLVGQPRSPAAFGPVPDAPGGAGGCCRLQRSARLMLVQPLVGTVSAGGSLAVGPGRRLSGVGAKPGRPPGRLGSGGAALSGMRRWRVGDPLGRQAADRLRTRTPLALGHLMSPTGSGTRVAAANSPPALLGTDAVRTFIPPFHVPGPPCGAIICTSRSLLNLLRSYRYFPPADGQRLPSTLACRNHGTSPAVPHTMPQIKHDSGGVKLPSHHTRGSGFVQRPCIPPLGFGAIPVLALCRGGIQG